MSAPLNFFSHYVSQLDSPPSLPEFKREDNTPKIIGEKKYKLNKSKCKFVSVGISCDFGYMPCVKLSGNKGDQVTFNEADWNKFLTHQGTIMNFLYYNYKTDTVDEGNICIHFDQFSNARVIRISKEDNYIYLAYETVCCLIEILPLVKYSIEMIKNLQFENYFKILRRGLQSQSGDIIENALNILKPEDNPKSENICMILELIYTYPDVFESACSTTV